MSLARRDFQIGGMDCAACAGKIEEELKSLDGVEAASVDFTASKALVDYDPKALDEKSIRRRIEELGYTAVAGPPARKKPGKTTVMVGGMTCAACVRRVENAIKDVDGVEDATVNLATSRATVVYSPDAAGISAIRSAIEEAGYEFLGIYSRETGDRTDEARREKLADLKRKVAVGAVLSVLIMAGSMRHAFPFLHAVPVRLMLYILLVLSTPAVFWVGKRFLTGAVKATLHKTADMNTLVAIGALSAYIYSALATFFPWFFAAPGREPPIYFDGAAMIVTLVLLGRFLELKARGKTSDAIKKLMKLSPKTACVIRDGSEADVPVEEVVPGDLVVIRPGSSIPTDGTVASGQSAVDESMLTGESMPVSKNPGDEAFAGTINQSGSFVMKATRVGAETALARIIRLVEEAQGSKAPIQHFADKVASIFAPTVIVLAVVTFAIWYFAVPDHVLSRAILNFVSVLIISCPCAMGLATPTAVMVGAGLGAESGILIKGGESLERAHNLNTIIFDKTGTITKGEPAVTDVAVASGFSETGLLELAAPQANLSEHPLSKAIAARAREMNAAARDVEDFESVAGFGSRAKVDGQDVLIGSWNFIRSEGAITEELEEKAEIFGKSGKTCVFVASGGKLAGIIALADTIRPSAPRAVSLLREMGLEVMMLTGDRRQTAEAIARQAGIDRVLSEVLPGDKAGEVRRLQGEGRITGMVGDGVNDAPALAAADVGIAVGAGADIAIEASDITLIRDDLLLVPSAVKLSSLTMRIIKQNLFWAFFYNTIGIPIAAGALYPFFGILLNPMFAAAAMAMSSVSVVSNALRLRRVWRKQSATPGA